MSTTVKRASAYIDKWLPKFGFGHYHYTVRRLPNSKGQDIWARCFWNHEDEEVIIEVNDSPNEIFKMSERELETVILHEFTHGLLELADTSDHATEVVCNRIPRLLLGRRHTPANRRLSLNHTSWDEKQVVHPGTTDYLGLLVDGLSEEERRVIEGLFWEGRTFDYLARELNCSTRTVGRIRDEALGRLNPLVAELSEFLEGQVEYECESE